MWLGDSGIFQHSSSRCCQGRRRTSHSCLPSITRCCLLVWLAGKQRRMGTRPGIWRLRGQPASLLSHYFILSSRFLFKLVPFLQLHCLNFHLRPVENKSFVFHSTWWNLIRPHRTASCPETLSVCLSLLWWIIIFQGRFITGRFDDSEAQKLHDFKFHKPVWNRVAPILRFQFHIGLITALAKPSNKYCKSWNAQE